MHLTLPLILILLFNLLVLSKFSEETGAGDKEKDGSAYITHLPDLSSTTHLPRVDNPNERSGSEISETSFSQSTGEDCQQRNSLIPPDPESLTSQPPIVIQPGYLLKNRCCDPFSLIDWLSDKVGYFIEKTKYWTFFYVFLVYVAYEALLISSATGLGLLGPIYDC